MKLLCLVSLWLVAAPAWAKIEIPSNDKILTLLRAKVGTKVDNYYERSVKRVGDKTVAVEIFASSEGDYKYAPKIFGDFPKYREWILHNINKRPSGGTYYLQMKDLVVKPGEPDIIVGNFVVDLPVFKKDMFRRFRAKSSQDKESFLVTVESVPLPDSVIGSGDGFMKVFPAPNNGTRLWYYLRGEVKIRNWLLYEALPDKLLARESGERVQQLLDNYLAQEDRLKSADRKSASDR